MAYACTLAAVEEEHVDEYRNRRRPFLTPSKSISCSHFIAYAVQPQPLGRLLGEAIDGGERIRDDLWHPFRYPIVHRKAEVLRLQPQLQAAWSAALDKHGQPEATDWYAQEIGKVLDLFRYAHDRGLSVIRVLEAPFDEQRAKKVKSPLGDF